MKIEARTRLTAGSSAALKLLRSGPDSPEKAMRRAYSALQQAVTESGEVPRDVLDALLQYAPNEKILSKMTLPQLHTLAVEFLKDPPFKLIAKSNTKIEAKQRLTAASGPSVATTDWFKKLPAGSKAEILKEDKKGKALSYMKVAIQKLQDIVESWVTVPDSDMPKSLTAFWASGELAQKSVSAIKKERGACHWYTGYMWMRGDGAFATGFAYDSYGRRWYAHSWIVEPSGNIIEPTTSVPDKYWGTTLTDAQAKKAVKEMMPTIIGFGWKLTKKMTDRLN